MTENLPTGAPLRVGRAPPRVESSTVKVEFRTLDGVEERAVPSTGYGCVKVVVNGRLGGYLSRDLPEESGGRWFCSAWPHWPEGSRLQVAGLHDAVLSLDLEDAQRSVLARLVPPG